jgi:tetratricopeptide (TPR) repeat protein
MSVHVQRAQLLYDQGRHEMAGQEARLALGEDPDNLQAGIILALCLTDLEKYDEAEAEAGRAIGLAPDFPVTHYVMARVLQGRNRIKEAIDSVREAISLDPHDPDFHGFLSALLFEQSRWRDALASAEKGLENDAEHVVCSNLRAMALVKLGRREEAGQTMDATLARSPEDSFSQATRGWTRIEEHNPKEALEHFREAIRLDPTSDSARAGIVEALKARNPIYGLFLRYLLFMGKLPPGLQMGLVFGALIGIQILGGLRRSHPEWSGWIFGVEIGYLVLVLLSWTAIPFFNLLLRFNPMGRHALTEEQTLEANWIGMLLGLGAVSLGGFFIDGLTYLWGAAFFVGLIFPVVSLFKCPPGWPRIVMQSVTAGLVIMGLSGLALLMSGESGRSRGEDLMVYFVWGAALSTWVGNILPAFRVRR